VFALIESGEPCFDGGSFVGVSVHGRDGVVHEVAGDAAAEFAGWFEFIVVIGFGRVGWEQVFRCAAVKVDPVENRLHLGFDLGHRFAPFLVGLAQRIIPFATSLLNSLLYPLSLLINRTQPFLHGRNSPIVQLMSLCLGPLVILLHPELITLHHALDIPHQGLRR